jgi:hypothetical protein
MSILTLESESKLTGFGGKKQVKEKKRMRTFHSNLEHYSRQLALTRRKLMRRRNN